MHSHANVTSTSKGHVLFPTDPSSNNTAVIFILSCSHCNPSASQPHYHLNHQMPLSCSSKEKKSDSQQGFWHFILPKNLPYGNTLDIAIKKHKVGLLTKKYVPVFLKGVKPKLCKSTTKTSDSKDWNTHRRSNSCFLPIINTLNRPELRDSHTAKCSPQNTVCLSAQNQSLSC